MYTTLAGGGDLQRHEVPPARRAGQPLGSSHHLRTHDVALGHAPDEGPQRRAPFSAARAVVAVVFVIVVSARGSSAPGKRSSNTAHRKKARGADGYRAGYASLDPRSGMEALRKQAVRGGLGREQPSLRHGDGLEPRLPRTRVHRRVVANNERGESGQG